MKAPFSQLDASLNKLLDGELGKDINALGKTATASAIQAVVAGPNGLCFEFARGRRTLLGPAQDDVGPATPMDIASLTKPLVGATLAMQAVDEGLVAWHTPLSELLPLPAKGDLGQATFLHLLNHGSGLPAWRQFYLEGFPFNPTPDQAVSTAEAILEAILATPLGAVPGTRHEYSDLGYILLAHLIEELFGEPLDELAEARIFSPLAMKHTCFARNNRLIAGAVATEHCPHREGLVMGSVHDENTHIMGGVSAHAGVFSNALDLYRFTSHLTDLDAGRLKDGIVQASTLRFCWSPEAAVPGGSHRGGWDTPSGARSSAGRGFCPASSVGHLGFSGTSIWIERTREITAILLTNRVHPSRDNDRIKGLRIKFHEAVLPP